MFKNIANLCNMRPVGNLRYFSILFFIQTILLIHIQKEMVKYLDTFTRMEIYFIYLGYSLLLEQIEQAKADMSHWEVVLPSAMEFKGLADPGST